MQDIDAILSMLSWDNDEAIQQKGISEAQKIKHLSVLFQPIKSKSIWENCAKVLASKCNIELVPYLYLMFEWLRDFNWPGADIMFNRLLDIPIESLQGAYRYSLEQAKARNDVPWELCLLDFQEEYQVRRNTGDRSNAISTENRPLC